MRIVFLCLGLVTTAAIQAAPPEITDIAPRGLQRGKPIEAVITGNHLTAKTKLILPFKATQEVLPEAQPDPAKVRTRVNVDAATPVGIYPARVMSEEGVSSILLMSIDALPSANETEDNDAFEKAQRITTPGIVSGQLLNNDVDYYRFAAQRGQRLVVEVEAARIGSGLHPHIRLLDSRRRFLGSDNDTPGLKRDCRLLFTAPADGEYVVEVQDVAYRGSPPPHYRLKIADYDFWGEIFPLGGRRGDTVEFTLRGGTLSGETRLQQKLNDRTVHGLDWLTLDPVLKPGMPAPILAVSDLPERIWLKSDSKDPRRLDVLPPIIINSRLEKKGDTDRFQLAVKPGQRIRIAVEAERFGSLLDGVLTVTDQKGNQIVQVDDVPQPPPAEGFAATQHPDPAAEVVVPEGANLLTIDLRDQRLRGGLNYVYRLRIEPTVPDFSLQQPLTEVNVPRGGSALLTVPVARNGYTGPIKLTIPDLPPGLSIQGGDIGANLTTGVLLLSAAADAPAPAEPYQLQIEGKATIEKQLVRRRAVQELVLARDINVPASTWPLESFALALRGAEPFAVRGPASIEVVQGYAATLPVEVIRAAGQENLALQVAGTVPAAPPPPGQTPPTVSITVPEVAVAAGAKSATLSVTAPLTNPEGAFPFVITGKAKVKDVDQTVVGSLVTLNITKPFAVELLTRELTLVPGQTVAFKGRIQRKSVFKEVVQLKLDGLPAGVSIAGSRPLAGDWSEFQIDLKVDAKAAAATTNLTFTASTTIGGQAFNHPGIPVPVKVGTGKK